MTHRGALIASFALTIAVALVLGTQWDLITTRGSQADPTATPSAPAEEFIDPNASDSTDPTGGPGVAAQSGLSLGALNDTSSGASQTTLFRASTLGEAGTTEGEPRRRRGL